MTEIRDIIEELDPEGAGVEMHELMRELYPICRSITGAGVRRSLEILRTFAPLVTHEVPSGTPVFDWVVPREWTFRSAKLVAPDGTVALDAARLNLHVLGYSVPFHGVVPLEELQLHLHSLPARPKLVPYRTAYYSEEWGFCLSQEQRDALVPGDYEVLIDTDLRDGSLTFGELVIPGTTGEEVLISTHCCHPSLANDNLSGMVLSAMLARLLLMLPQRRYTYRFLFVPGTIGSITWLALNEERARRIVHGLVVAGVGDGGRLTYKRSRRGNATIDRAVAHVLAHAGEDYEVRDFTPYGYDERQYCSPGFDLAVGSLTRTPYGEYPEYHTSGDDLGFVQPGQLGRSLLRYLEVLEVLELDATYVNQSPKCEPQLGKRGLYPSVGGQGRAATAQMAMLWVLSLSDGKHSLLDITERSGLCFSDVSAAAVALESTDLLRLAAPAGSCER